MYNINGAYADTYTDACLIAGVDTPAQAASEARWIDQHYAVFGCHPFEEPTTAHLRTPVDPCETHTDIPY